MQFTLNGRQALASKSCLNVPITKLWLRGWISGQYRDFFPYNAHGKGCSQCYRAAHQQSFCHQILDLQHWKHFQSCIQEPWALCFSHSALHCVLVWNWKREDETERQSHAGQMQECQTVSQSKIWYQWIREWRNEWCHWTVILKN